MMVPILLPLAVLANGLAAGGLMIALLGGAPLQFVLAIDEYVRVQQFLTTRFDPFMPICLVTTILADAALAFLVPTGPTRALAAAGAVLVAGAITVSFTRNAPINRWLSTLDPEALPPNWSDVDPRIRWRNWNAVRTTLAVTALVVNATAVGTQL